QQRIADESKLKDLKMKNYLFQSIDRSILETILVRDSAQDIWDAMRRKYQGSTKVKRAQLQAVRREFEILAMGESETVDEYFARTLAIANRMTSHGERMEQVTVVEKILRSMTSKFNYVCHKLGHYQSECPDWGESSNYAKMNEEEEMFLMAKTENDCDDKKEVWFLDSGCSNHMVGNKNWLYECDENYRDSVKLGDDSKMNVMGKGSLKLNINGRIHTLQQRNVTIIFKNDECRVFHEEKGILFTSHMSTNRMYMVRAIVITPRCLQVTKEEWTQLWHNRYGHLSIKGLNTLVKKQMVKGLPDFEDIAKKCSDCLVGKQHRDVIPKQAMRRATMKLELVHSDICGPIHPKSNAGSRNVPKKFRPEAVRWANYVVNRSPTLSVKDITPEEA
ncbi:hypothetical protein A2U01_0006339, partial [Trifolium medium]|nr:hypothetical protein [Trifolium medium]